LRYTPFLFTDARGTPHLHSFPTRRSSDLPMLCTPRVVTRKRAEELEARIPTCSAKTGSCPQPLCRPPLQNVAPVCDAGRCVAQRSEEHTSELQSLRHLVCRLLLEKKNDQL